MSVTSAMFTGVSGLLANAEGINVIGNNLANVNTIGFKSGRMLFSDMLSVNIGNSSQIGRGTQIQKVDNVFSQGSFETTESVTDIALQGSSFFALKAPATTSPLTSQSEAILTRAGAFRVDGDRYLVNPDGYQVVDTSGNPIQFSDNATAITAAVTTFQADPSIAALSAALGVDIAAADAVVTAYVAPLTAAQNAVVALQTAATAKMTAANDAITAFTAGSPASTADAAAAALNAALASIQAYANAAGTAVTATTVTAPATTSPSEDFDTAYSLLTTEEGKAFAKVTKIDGDGSITYLDKAGNANYYTTTNAAGSYTSTGIPGEKIAVINPSNPGALDKLGGTLFRIAAGSGVSTLGFSVTDNAANGTSEKIYSNSLEQSNVDMAGQFVKMILTQRAYSANSKTITTADEMTQEVLNLKR